MKKLICTTIVTLMTIGLAYTQNEGSVSDKPTLDISGSADVYFRANLGGEYDYAPGTSFANLPGFSLGMANVILSQEGTKFGFTADLVFGPRGEDATFASGTLRSAGDLGTNSSGIVNQLYAYWKPTDKLTLTLGNFNTFLGYEVISPTGNFNYSTSYMFSYGPFSHTGLKADLDLGSGFSLMAAVMNPTDFTEYNLLNEYAGGLQLGYEAGGLGVWVNGLFSDGFTQFDITAGYDVTDDLYVGFNATSASDSFMGIAGYVQYALSDDFKLGVRAENFQDKGLELFTEDESVFDFTISANYTVGSLTFIPEFRLDSFSDDIVPDGDGGVANSASSFVLAAVYGF